MWCDDEQHIFGKLIFHSKTQPSHMLPTTKDRRGFGQRTFKHPDHLTCLSREEGVIANRKKTTVPLPQQTALKKCL